MNVHYINSANARTQCFHVAHTGGRGEGGGGERERHCVEWTLESIRKIQRDFQLFILRRPYYNIKIQLEIEAYRRENNRNG